MGGGSCCDKTLLPEACRAHSEVQTPCQRLPCPAPPGLRPQLTPGSSKLITLSHWPYQSLFQPRGLCTCCPLCLDITSLAPSDPSGLSANVTSLDNASKDACFVFITPPSGIISMFPLSSLLSLKSKPHGYMKLFCLVHLCIPSAQNRAWHSACSGDILWVKESGKEPSRCPAGCESSVWGSVAEGKGVKTSLSFAESKGGSGEGCFCTLTGLRTLLASGIQPRAGAGVGADIAHRGVAIALRPQQGRQALRKGWQRAPLGT